MQFQHQIASAEESMLPGQIGQPIFNFPHHHLLTKLYFQMRSCLKNHFGHLQTARITSPLLKLCFAVFAVGIAAKENKSQTNIRRKSRF